MEDKETLQTGAVVGNAADLVEDLVNELLADGVVTTGIVVRGILLACDHLLGVEERAVGTGADLVDDIGLEIGVDGTGDILALACTVLVMHACIYMRLCWAGDDCLPVSEKKVLKPWSSLTALRSSVR